MSSSGTFSIVWEDDIPGGGIGTERLIIADGVFSPGGAHLGLFRTEENSSIILVWKEDSFDIWRVD
jgi:hypothetical protein